MATTTDMRQSIDEQIARAHVPKSCSQVYWDIWKAYQVWVDKPDTAGTRGMDGKYLTRYNVDFYFLNEIVKRSIVPKSARRYRAALQFMADNYEHAPPTERFIVSSPAVTTALNSQQACYQEKQLITYTSAHDRLPTNNLTPSEEAMIIHYGMQIMAWKDFCVAFNTCTQTMIRGDGIREIRLCDLHLDDVHGPGGFRSDKLPMVALIQQAYTGKKKEARKRMMGMWRHAEWYKCGTGMIAASLACRLRDDTHLHFRHTHGNPDWYKYKLVRWTTYDAHRKVYQRVYNGINISWGKVTHLRKQGIDKAKQGGASRDDISQQTGHGKESIDISYLPHLPQDVMQVAAGFSLRHGETMYFVPRLFVQVDDPEFPLVPNNPNISDAELTTMIFPYYQRWVNEYESSLKWKCGANFLHDLLPFLSRVLVQDGVYWVEKFPLHEVSRLLISSFGDRYLEWADKQRKTVSNIEENAKKDEIKALEAGSQAAFSSLKGDNVHIVQAIGTLTAKVIHLTEVVEMQQKMQATQQQHTLATNQFIGLRQNQTKYQATGPTREQMVGLCPPATLVPYFKPELPDSFQALLEEHLKYKLEDFKGVSKSSWGHALAMSYSRRSYLYRLIVEKAVKLRSGHDMAYKLQEAARQLEEERGTMTMYKFYDAKKRSDTKRQKRKINPVEGGRKRTRRIEI
jgi:Centromere DNA-binding protein complex CBF3 subunit, domain 2